MCKSSLEASVRKTNEFNSGYSKKRGSLAVQDEEKKLEKDIADWSGGRFLLENGGMKVVEKLPSIPPVQLTPVRAPVVAAEAFLPRKGYVYDKMPE